MFKTSRSYEAGQHAHGEKEERYPGGPFFALDQAKQTEQKQQKEREQNTTFDILDDDGIFYEVEQTVYHYGECREYGPDDFRITPWGGCRGEYRYKRYSEWQRIDERNFCYSLIHSDRLDLERKIDIFFGHAGVIRWGAVRLHSVKAVGLETVGLAETACSRGSTLAARSEKLESVHVDFGDVALLTAGLVGPAAVGEKALYFQCFSSLHIQAYSLFFALLCA